ncbi:MAG: rhomboid family intramembrane serine protease [Flavobacteriales bacterium]|jgi:membrane associated rhomboid family serine protease|nr:rhomboid family intramembrane serine protease [Flavobacteriales bacterium]MBT5090524.1 rhomboid family intramembrane serine protease [Flavobacteriales bacterium]MBT5749830.1 rhomboid family intramembrane serine protease [Flavobacteriales bacterium]
MYRPSSFSQLPEIVKNLLIINGLFFLATISLESYGIDFTKWFALHQFQSPDFMPHQLITHFFMHGNFTHLLFNMFALWMFGKILENVWGGKRFLTYYMITGIGAAFVHLTVSQYQIIELGNGFPELMELAKNGRYNTGNVNSLKLTQLVTTPTVGASGAVFGILLAFGMLFPNTLLYIYFAIPVKAKYFVIIYGIMELYAGISNNPADNVAHFAHLGGMLFGFILLKYWQKNNTQFY